MGTRSDEGLYFAVIVRKKLGPPWELFHRTTDRTNLLAWVTINCAADDALWLRLEAEGPAARQMLAALQFGLEQMSKASQ